MGTKRYEVQPVDGSTNMFVAFDLQTSRELDMGSELEMQELVDEMNAPDHSAERGVAA